MKAQLSYLDQVQRGVDFIEARLEEDVDLFDVSKTAGMSHWHFQRIFKALTGETLKTYVRARRMANALERLLTSRDRILDIALEAGFETQESFTRAFKDAFGMTPGAYRRLGDRSLFLKKVAFDSSYLEHINQNLSLSPDIVEQSRMRLVGLRTEGFGTGSDKNTIGAKLPPLWGAFMARIDELEGRIPGVCYGVVQPSSANSEELEYFAAAEVEPNAPIPAGMTAVEIPAATYARFSHRGLAKDIDHTVNFIYSTWLATSEHRHTYGPDLEIYGAEYRGDSADSVYEYAIPVATTRRF